MPAMQLNPCLALSIVTVAFLSACQPSAQTERNADADAVPTKAEPPARTPSAGDSTRDNDDSAARAEELGRVPPPAKPSRERTETTRSGTFGNSDAVGATKAGVAAAPRTQEGARRAGLSGDWANLAKAQLRRPTDFAKLTAELKRKQALAAGLDETAVRAELEKRALTGDADAALTLGLMLRYGEVTSNGALATTGNAPRVEVITSGPDGDLVCVPTLSAVAVPAQFTEAERLICAAAEAGNARAMAELGRILLADETRADGPALAEGWLRKAWAAGESEGAYLLASAERLGLLEPAAGDDPTALLIAAAAQGNEASRLLLSMLRKELDETGCDKLAQWLAETADTGNVPAMLELAALKKEAGDYTGAVGWLERAAANGSTNAIMELALSAANGSTRNEARESAIAHLRVQLDNPTTTSPHVRFALAALLVLRTDNMERNQAESLELLRASGENIKQASVAAMLIEDGLDARVAMQTVLKMDDDTAYVRRVEMLRERNDTTYSACADGMPKPLKTITPIYPVELQASGTTGDVTVQFVVGADGTVADCTVLLSDHPALSAAAVEAVKQWRFQPGVKNGRPVAAQLQLTFPFRLAQ
jgi:TonB family protein